MGFVAIRRSKMWLLTKRLVLGGAPVKGQSWYHSLSALQKFVPRTCMGHTFAEGSVAQRQLLRAGDSGMES